jgi:hypothetical protein
VRLDTKGLICSDFEIGFRDRAYYQGITNSFLRDVISDASVGSMRS